LKQHAPKWAWLNLEQAMDNPLTTAERNRCIASLQEDNRREATRAQQVVLNLLFWFAMSSLPFWLRLPGLTKSNEIALAGFCIDGIALVICTAVLNRFVFRKIAECMRRHVAPILAQTPLVKHVLALPSAAKAYHNSFNAWAADGIVLGKQRPYGLERGVKAVCTRFGAWARYFKRSPEPWAVRAAIYSFSLAFVSSFALLDWYMNRPHVRERFLHAQGEVPLSFWIGMGPLVLFVLWLNVFYGRRAGIRSALIDHFEAEAARGDGMRAADGACDG
jgi:hypothetical protein